MNSLRGALASGYKARLIKMNNEDCEYPIKKNLKNDMSQDFRTYEFSSGTLQTREEIACDTSKSDFEKYLTANYKTCYGTVEAMNKYYKDGLLSKDNFKGIGCSHLVLVKDMIRFFMASGQQDRVEHFEHYMETEPDNRHFYDNYRRIQNDKTYSIKKYKRKLWVVELLKDEDSIKIPFMVKVLNVILFPIKFIPKRSVLRMPEYKNISYSIGGVTNGFAIQFTIPKKFSFK